MATVVLEFVPYLGAVLMMAALTITSIAAFDSVGRILAPPAAYLIVTTIQNNVVSPLAYGNGLKLNPVAVLLGVILWWFLWGIPRIRGGADFGGDQDRVGSSGSAQIRGRVAGGVNATDSERARRNKKRPDAGRRLMRPRGVEPPRLLDTRT